VPGDLVPNSFELFISRRPGSDDQNVIQSFNDAQSLSIEAGVGQTANLLTITSESDVDLFSVSPITTILRGSEFDGTTLSIYSSPENDSGSFALRIFNNTGSAEGLSIRQFSGSLTTYIYNLTVDSNTDLFFSSNSGLPASGSGYISAAWNNLQTTGYINLDSSSSFSAGFINISGGASAAGGSINTSNGGGSIDTTGSGAIGFGTSANRINLVGTSGSNGKTITLPNITGTAMVSTAITTASRLVLSTTTAGSHSYLTTPNNRVLTSNGSGVPTWASTVSVSLGGTGQSTANAGFNALSPMTTLGDIIYGAASGVGTRLAGNTTTTLRVLTQTGTGSASAAPAWATVSSILPANVAYIDVSNIFTQPQKLPNGTETTPSLTFSSDTNTGIFRYDTDQIGLTAGGFTSTVVHGEGIRLYNNSGTEEHTLSFFENTFYGDYIWNLGYDYAFGTWIQKMSVPLQLVGGGMFFTYNSGQLCEFASIYDLGLGDEFFIGPYNDDAGITTGVNVNLRYGRGNSVGSVISIDGANQTLDATGLGLKLKRTATATSYTATAADYIIAVTSTASARTITLPAVSGTTGRIYVVKDESGGAATNNITIDGNASETIDGATTKVINTNYGTATIYSNGSAWFSI